MDDDSPLLAALGLGSDFVPPAQATTIYRPGQAPQRQYFGQIRKSTGNPTMDRALLGYLQSGNPAFLGQVSGAQTSASQALAAQADMLRARNEQSALNDPNLIALKMIQSGTPGEDALKLAYQMTGQEMPAAPAPKPPAPPAPSPQVLGSNYGLLGNAGALSQALSGYGLPDFGSAVSGLLGAPPAPAGADPLEVALEGAPTPEDRWPGEVRSQDVVEALGRVAEQGVGKKKRKKKTPDAGRIVPF